MLARWLLGVVLKAFLCPRQKIVVIFGARDCDLGGLVLPFWHRRRRVWHLGGTLSDLGSSRKDTGVSRVAFIDLGLILVPHFESFSGTEGFKSGVVSRFVSMSLLTSIFGSKSGHLGS